MIVMKHFLERRQRGVEHELDEAALREQAVLAQLRADATQALQQPAAVQTLLQNVAALLVERLDAAFARVWTLDTAGQVLELQASAGLYTHLNGPHGRVPVGQLKIGRIAEERRPLVTNQVIGDPHVPDQDWARREGLLAFAGFPLLLEGRLLGVVALFARHSLTPAAVETFSAVAGILAQALGRKQAEAQVAALNSQLAAELADMNRLHAISTHFVRHNDLRTLLGAILNAALAITGAAKGHVQLLDRASGELGIIVQEGYEPAFLEFFSRIHPGTVACGTALQTGKCVTVEDVSVSPLFLAEPRALELVLAAGIRSVVCTPLVTAAGESVGVLSTHFAARCHPRDRELRLLDLLARQAADFVERVQAEDVLRVVREELARVNQNLERKVQERTAELRETVAELEHFSYTITHDMRAPLRAMRGLGGILLEECVTCLNPERCDYIRRIADAAGRMDRLITDALQYSGVVRRQFELEPVDADSLLRGILESYPQFQTPHADIRIEGELPKLLGNTAALTQCFSNLLGNAVKFVQPGKTPEVRVYAEARDDFARLWFEDKGIGIEPEYQSKIWQMFQQLNKSYEGTGIGLALVSKSVERMGGRVGVESQPGQGSRFWIELKLADGTK